MNGSTKTAALAGCLFGGAFFLLAGDGIWTSEGPAHTVVFSLALGEPPRTLFASSWGLLRSSEVGSWSALPNTSQGDGGVLAVDPSNPGVLYTVGDSALIKSTDNADHFQVLSGVSLSHWGAIAIDPTRTSTVYVGGDKSAGGVVYKSDDGGTSWSALNTDSLVETIAKLVIDPMQSENLCAGSYVTYEYPGYPGPVSANNALIGTRDGGASWTVLLGQTDAEVELYEVAALAVDPQTGGLYAGTTDSEGGSIYRSPGRGEALVRTPIGMGLRVFGVQAIAIDPATPTTLYAGTRLAGVFRSLDGGSTWAPMNDGLVDDETYGHANRYSGLGVYSLMLDPADGVLRAGTENGVFAIRPSASSFPCAPTANQLCLLGGRYRVSVMAQNPATWEIVRGSVVQQAERFGSFSFPDFTADPTFPEVVVKMLDPDQGRAGVWVFEGSLTGLPYVLTVTDTTTGQIETYTNDSQNHFCGGADTSAFADPPRGPWDYVSVPSPASGARSTDADTLSLLGGRFAITLSAHRALQGHTEPGAAVALGDRYGYFSLPGFTGDPSFPEVYVKMVDARAVNGRFWFFHSGLTSLDYTLTVTDTVTGSVRTYGSTTAFCGGADTSAFSD